MTGDVRGCNAVGVPLRDFYVSHSAEDFGLDASHDGMTRAEFADECDINILLARYETSGVINHFNRATPQYLDLGDGVPDLQSALDMVARAEEAFMTLNAKTRAEFDNDPVKFVQFAEDPANLEKMREWGLARPAPAPEPPVKVEVTNPPAAPQGA